METYLFSQKDFATMPLVEARAIVANIELFVKLVRSDGWEVASELIESWQEIAVDAAYIAVMLGREDLYSALSPVGLLFNRIAEMVNRDQAQDFDAEFGALIGAAQALGRVLWAKIQLCGEAATIAEAFSNSDAGQQSMTAPTPSREEFAPTKQDLEILMALLRAPGTLTQAEIAGHAHVSQATLRGRDGKIGRLKALLEAKMIHRPHGPRKGYALTDAGRDVAKKFAEIPPAKRTMRRKMKRKL